MQCPACGETSKFKFDLSDHEVYHGNDLEGTNITDNEDGTFSVELPFSTIKAVIRPLTGSDELHLINSGNKKDPMENIITKQMKAFVASFNGYDDPNTIAYVCENMVAGDSRFLRDCFKLISPDIKMEAEFVCKHCGHEEVMMVPFGADFLWPER